jgi:hypothetical protein
LRTIAIGTVVSEVFLPWTLFIPFKNHWWRILNACVFIAMHLGIIALFSIGLFSYICIVIWLAVLPGAIWDRLGWRSGVRSVPNREASWWRRAGTVAVYAFCALMIPFMLLWNVINIRQDWVVAPIYDPHRPKIVRDFDESKNIVYLGFEFTGHALGVGQHFQMFGSPPADDAWYVYRAKLRNGTERDVFLDGREIPDEGPLTGPDTMPHFHWRQLHRNLTDAITTFVRQRMAVFMAERWNRHHPPEEQVESLRLECYFDQFWPDAIPGEARGAVIWGTYPDDPYSPFESMLNRVLQGAEPRGF